MIKKKLHITLFDGSFKTTPFINRLAKGLATHGHTISIIGFNEHNPHPIPNVIYQSLGSNRAHVRLFVTSLGLALGSKSLRAVKNTFLYLAKKNRKKLQQQNLNLGLKKLNPDIVHLQWPSLLPWMEPYMPYPHFKVILSQRGFHNNVRPFVDEANFKYLQKWYPKIAGFHSVSHAMATTGDKIWSAPEKLNRVVYTGLDLNRLSFSASYSQKPPLRLLSIGRAHWIKGYDYALRACKLLREKNIPFQYTIIGGADDEELQFLVHDLGLGKTVVLEQRLPQQEVFQRMAAASVLLMPSLEEGIPNVVVEAMALGLPVISTNCGGVPELIGHGVEGWLVPTRNPQALAGAIEDFLGLSPNRVEEVRLAARKKVEQQHNEEQMVKGMEDLYYKVLSLNAR